MIDYYSAVDSILSKILESFNIIAPPIVGYLPQIQWPNVEKQENVDGSKFWVRVSYQTVSSPQTSLSVCVGAIGKKSYTNTGLLTIQVFAPKSLAESNDILKRLSMAIRNSFRSSGANGGIWFRNPRIIELSQEELFYRNNVIIEYRFDELG